MAGRKAKGPKLEVTGIDEDKGEFTFSLPARYVQVSPNIWVAPYEIQGIEFENWDPSPKPELIVMLAPKVKAKCIMHMGFGLSLQFDMAPDDTPESIVAKLGGSRAGL